MRVGIDTHAAEGPASGNSTYVRGLVPALARLDADAHYVLYALDPHHPFYSQFLGHPRVTVRRLWPRAALARIPLSLAIASYRDRLDALHVQYVGPPHHRGALVVTIHDLAFLRVPESFPPLQARRLTWQVRANARRAAVVIAPSDYSRRDLCRAYAIDPGRIELIPLAADPAVAPVRDRSLIAPFTEALGITERYVLCVGRLNARKNLVGLLHAFERVRPALAEPAQLVIAGPRDHQADALDRAIAASPCGPDVVRVGVLGEGDLRATMCGATAFAYPSFFEGFGLPPLEAMACGVPVICSASTSLPEVVGDAALTFEPAHPDAIADALRRVLTEPELRADLAARGLARAARFTWEAAAERTFAAYRTACAAA